MSFSGDQETVATRNLFGGTIFFTKEKVVDTDSFWTGLRK